MALNHPTQTYTHPNNQLPLFGAHQISPADSATNSPNNASPTSPRSHTPLQYHVPGQVRQLRPMKSPLYVPAALRPTERPNKNPPTTPPKSLHGSLESLDDGFADDTRSAPLDLVVANDWFADEELGEVTGEPTREHWKADQQSPSCDSPQCRSNFNLFTRRHHCRHCGHIFCSDHSAFIIPLNQEARFHPDGIPSRACDTCHRHYQKWDTARSVRRRNSADGTSQDDGSSRMDFPTAGKSGLVSQGRSAGGGGGNSSEQTVGSVPKDWAWSTF
ncbi:hypothetical protein EPUS_03555 [Endocarpon pusillum Z07020]|uniref:FYVE-type domain-containing protein n=1 Tax=Endocarpon pusillum (strain Z07020 / HMAS-L-300199) TaxID=1263415 RepID=U1GD53_ENDPU|nr:uncharacterized protein EPUS_03555 [Endocarpon pusillum Z07020]ERF70003.1 hypothetical protein EPUS_03555 [Endocarpon pusillum Z07020]